MQTEPTQIIKQAIKLLQHGKLVIVPTETVYGLAADANNEQAIQKVFAVKGRPVNQPLAILIAQNAKLTNWAIDIPETAYQLAQNFWPGPLTMILKCNTKVSKLITSGLPTIGLRCPRHPITQQILQAFPQGLAAPSANIYGQPPPTHVREISTTLSKQVDLIIDGGKCEIGTVSTIVDLTSNKLQILRQGAITEKMLSDTVKS